jgi:AcrR family transcriptional regulator
MTTQPEVRPYHHGDLRAALLAQSERILEAEGVSALTLRAAARAAGVSHAAPKNHFGDLTGLLSELAAVGFNRFSESLIRAVISAGREPRDRTKALGRAYVAFARAYPGLFLLMFRGERLDAARPSLRDALEGFQEALGAAAARRSSPGVRPTAEETASWSLIHGFALLLLDGRLQPGLGARPSARDADRLLESVIEAARIGG